MNKHTSANSVYPDQTAPGEQRIPQIQPAVDSSKTDISKYHQQAHNVEMTSLYADAT